MLPTQIILMLITHLIIIAKAFVKISLLLDPDAVAGQELVDVDGIVLVGRVLVLGVEPVTFRVGVRVRRVLPPLLLTTKKFHDVKNLALGNQILFIKDDNVHFFDSTPAKLSSKTLMKETNISPAPICA